MEIELQIFQYFLFSFFSGTDFMCTLFEAVFSVPSYFFSQQQLCTHSNIIASAIAEGSAVVQ